MRDPRGTRTISLVGSSHRIARPPRTRGVLAPFTALAVAVSLPFAVHAQSLPSVEISTDLGTIVVELDETRAPRTVSNFLRYVDAGLYADGTFYRTVRLDNQPDDEVLIEVIQGGVDRSRVDEAFDPIEMEGTEATGLRHTDGVISMARGGPDTARGEFFICIGAQPELDEGGRRNPDGFGFAAFGRVIEGMEVVHRIHARETDGQRLVAPVRILGVERRERR